MRQLATEVENPVGAQYLRLRNARQMVDAGRAIWTRKATAEYGGRIRIIRFSTVVERVQGIEYDREAHRRRATLREMKGIPIVQAERMLIERQRRRMVEA